MANRKTSVVWDYFMDMSGFFVTCKMCKIKYS